MKRRKTVTQIHNQVIRHNNFYYHKPRTIKKHLITDNYILAHVYDILLDECTRKS